jgi:K+-sensing histidine kinase KdpD
MSYFAPAERASKEEIIRDTKFVDTAEELVDILNTIPNMVLILNQERQIVFINQTLIDLLGFKDREEALSKRPGELLHCIHASEEPGGCGTSKSCQYCGAVKTIMNCQESKELEEGDCRITSTIEGKLHSFDLKLTIKPYDKGESILYVLYMDDISSKKRKERLERIFFHDIINSSGGLMGLAKYLPTQGLNPKQEKIVGMIQNVSKVLVDEIEAQRDLLAAEQGRLETQMKEVGIENILRNSYDTLFLHKVSKDKKIELDPESFSVNIKTDKRLLRRVVVNLLKNAVEASTNEQTVTFGCKMDKDPKNIVIWIKNEKFMPEEVQSQIFQRSFSTKGVGRGIGTNSVKILTEEYLNGVVNFESSKDQGTTFYVHLPINGKK